MKKSDIYGIIGSAIFCLIVLLLLLFIYMPGAKMPEDEGIMVSFGDSFSGGGNRPDPVVQTPQPVQSTPPPTPNTPTPTPSTPENVMTQEDPSVAIARQEEERKRKEQQEAERKRQREEEQRKQEEERKKQEELKRQEEERRRQQQAIDNANALGNMFGSNVSDEGSGTGSGNEQQGNPAGKGSSGGNSWSLNGRSLIGTLIKPTYTRNEEGIITISIRVNEEGVVVSASPTTPSTISDEKIINAAMDAARKTKFSAGKGVVTGTITYNFILN